MKTAIFALCLALGTLAGRAAPVWKPQAGHEQIRLWPKTPPDAQPNQKPEAMRPVMDDPVAGKALVYYIALKDTHVPAEMHLYAEGGHAFGLRRTKQPITEWPDLVEKWLRTIGMIHAGNQEKSWQH